jgi:hypothetical protein
MSQVWVQTALRKCLSWETTMTMLGNSMRNSSSQDIESRSRPFVGSSRRRMSGLPKRACHLLHQLRMEGLGYAQARKEEGGLGFGFPASQLGELGFELAGSEAVGLGEILFRVDGLALPRYFIEAFIAHDDGIENLEPFEGEMVLFEGGHSGARCNRNFAPVVLKLPREDSEKSCLPGTIGPNDAIAVARGEFEVDVLEK